MSWEARQAAVRLWGNPALVNMGAIIASNWFTNKDGLLIVPNEQAIDEDDKYNLMRLLYTDSRHYMLPLDDKAAAQEENSRARTFLSNVTKCAAKRWKDTRDVWFIRCAANQPEPKRSSLVEVEPQQTPPDPTSESTPKPRQTPTDPTSESSPKPRQTPTESSPKPRQTPTDPTSESGPKSRSPSTCTGTVLGLSSVQQVRSGSPSPKSVRFAVEEQSLATSCLTSQALENGKDEAYFQAPATYPGDSFPEHMRQPQVQRLDKYYAGMKEEY